MPHSPGPRTPRDDDDLVDNRPREQAEDERTDVERTPAEPPADETRRRERPSDAGVEDRPRERESERQDVESP